MSGGTAQAPLGDRLGRDSPSAPVVEPPVTPVVPSGHHHLSEDQVCAIRIDGSRKGKAWDREDTGKKVGLQDPKKRKRTTLGDPNT